MTNEEILNLFKTGKAIDWNNFINNRMEEDGADIIFDGEKFGALNLSRKSLNRLILVKNCQFINCDMSHFSFETAVVENTSFVANNMQCMSIWSRNMFTKTWFRYNDMYNSLVSNSHFIESTIALNNNLRSSHFTIDGKCDFNVDAVFGIKHDPTLWITIANIVLSDPKKLDMLHFHGYEARNKCDTTHCLAGHAIVQSGPAGNILELLVAPGTAGLMLCPELAPHFYNYNGKLVLNILREMLNEKGIEV